MRKFIASGVNMEMKDFVVEERTYTAWCCPYCKLKIAPGYETEHKYSFHDKDCRSWRQDYFMVGGMVPDADSG